MNPLVKSAGDFDTIAPPCRIGVQVFCGLEQSDKKGGAALLMGVRKSVTLKRPIIDYIGKNHLRRKFDTLNLFVCFNKSIFNFNSIYRINVILKYRSDYYLMVKKISFENTYHQLDICFVNFLPTW